MGDSRSFPPAGAKTYKLFAVAGNPTRHESDAYDVEGDETEESMSEEAWGFAIEYVRPEGWYVFYDAEGDEVNP